MILSAAFLLLAFWLGFYSARLLAAASRFSCACADQRSRETAFVRLHGGRS